MNHTTQSAHIKAIKSVQVWTALVTPMHENGAVDFDTLRQLAQLQADAGNGVTLLGSTGEGLALNAQEHLEVVKCVTALNLSTPIMVAVGGYQLNEQIAWIEQCNALAIDAYLLASPIYAKPGVQGLTEWFLSLLNSATQPCMVYNVPSRSGVNIPVAAMQNIQDHQHCWAIKEASGELNTLLAYRQHCPDIDIYSGEDAMMPYLAGAGVKGLVSVAANIWPAETQRYVQQALSGDFSGLFPAWQQAVDAIFQVASPIPTKVLMQHKGLIPNNTLRAPLTAKELPANHQLKDIDQSITDWFLNRSQSQIIGVK